MLSVHAPRLPLCSSVYARLLAYRFDLGKRYNNKNKKKESTRNRQKPREKEKQTPATTTTMMKSTSLFPLACSSVSQSAWSASELNEKRCRQRTIDAAASSFLFTNIFLSSLFLLRASVITLPFFWPGEKDKTSMHCQLDIDRR
jgi:hypothetical protein